MTVTANFSDGSTATLPANALHYQSTNTAVALVSDTGQVEALTNGTSVLIVTMNGLTAATPITVGDPDTSTLQFFPLNYVLGPNGQTRQFLVRQEVDLNDINDVSTAADGTTYFVDGGLTWNYEGQ